MKITEETAQKYLGSMSACPACGEKGNPEGGSIEIEGESAYQQLVCTECLAEWSDVYDLTGLSFLVTTTVRRSVNPYPSHTRARRNCSQRHRKPGTSYSQGWATRGGLSNPCGL